MLVTYKLLPNRKSFHFELQGRVDSLAYEDAYVAIGFSLDDSMVRAVIFVLVCAIGGARYEIQKRSKRGQGEAGT
jgi:hypothetical protein